jgi:hypothetical protein
LIYFGLQQVGRELAIRTPKKGYADKEKLPEADLASDQRRCRQQDAASPDSHKKPPVRRAKARKSIAEFDATHRHAEIAREAYLLWLDRGCAHGGDFEDWTRAIEIVRQRHLA